ncbi:MAG: C39 family peptidase [Patescibacteria group bacterium]|nr:C39 family peptidase [Patescibacteria group bacterium]
MNLKKIFVYIFLPIFLITSVPAGYYGSKKVYRYYLNQKNHSQIEPAIPSTTDQQPSAISYPPGTNLPIDFYSQAPYADWSMPYQEACEEASLIMAYNFVAGIQMSLEEFHQELLDLVDWEIGYFGYYEHTTLEETAEILTEYYDFSDWEILEIKTIQDLKPHLSAGNPIIAPFAGRMLENPNYTGEGPYYHMMVLRGYDESHVITNDVGTRNGENYQYTYNVLLESLHNWHDIDISLGEKVVLVLKNTSSLLSQTPKNLP